MPLATLRNQSSHRRINDADALHWHNAFRKTLSEADNDVVVAGINRECVASEKAPSWAERHSQSTKEEREKERKSNQKPRRDSKRRSVAQLARDHNIFRAPGNRTWPRVSVRDLLKDRIRAATLNAFLPRVRPRANLSSPSSSSSSSAARENRSAKPIVTQSVAWRACVQECNVNRPLLRRGVTRRRVISSGKSTARRGRWRGARREPHSCYSTITPRRHTCGLSSFRLRRSITSSPQDYFDIDRCIIERNPYARTTKCFRQQHAVLSERVRRAIYSFDNKKKITEKIVAR